MVKNTGCYRFAVEWMVTSFTVFLVTDHSFIFKSCCQSWWVSHLVSSKWLSTLQRYLVYNQNTVFVRFHRLSFSTRFLLFPNKLCMYTNMCICTRTHTHTPHTGAPFTLTTSSSPSFLFRSPLWGSSFSSVGLFLDIHLSFLSFSDKVLFLPILTAKGKHKKEFLKLRKQSNELWLLSALRRIRAWGPQLAYKPQVQNSLEWEPVEKKAKEWHLDIYKELRSALVSWWLELLLTQG